MRSESVFLLAGPETGKRAAFVAEIRSSMTKADGAPPEEHRLYANDTSIGDLLSLLMNSSLFSTRRLIEFRGAELVKGKDEINPLTAYIAKPATDAVLLLETDAFYIEKGIEDAVGKDRKKTFYELFDNEKPRWIERRLGDFGITIDEDATDALLELIENDTSALESACSRLAVLFPRGTRLSEADVEAAVARNRQEDAFSLFARIAIDETGWALEILETVLADRQGGAVQILSALVWSFRRLHRLHVLIETGESFDMACIKSGIKAKSLQALHRKALGRYTRRDCERIIRLAGDFDARIRATGATLEKPLLQLFIYGVMEKYGDLDLSALAVF